MKEGEPGPVTMPGRRHWWRAAAAAAGLVVVVLAMEIHRYRADPPGGRTELLFGVAIAVTAVLLIVALVHAYRTERSHLVAALNPRAEGTDETGAIQAELAASASRHHALMEALADGVFVAQDHRFVFANPALARMLGHAPEDFVDVPFERVVAPDVLPLWRERFEQRIGPGAEPPRAYEVRFVKADGQPIALELLASRVSHRGRPAVLGVLRDITERKQVAAELAQYRTHLEELVEQRTAQMRELNAGLQQAEAFMRLVADNIPGRIAYWDDGLRCRFANRVYCEWFGLQPEQLIGRTPDEVFGPNALREQRQQAALRGERLVFEREESDAHGYRAMVQVHYVPDVRDERVHGFFVLALDVSEARRHEQALQQLNESLVVARDEAHAAGRAKSAFLANMSHEIRTPLNAIIGLAHLIRRDNPSGPSAERLARVSEAGRHLLELVNGILDLSKIESGKLVIEDVDFVLDNVLGRALGLIAEAARDKGLELVVSTDDVPTHLRGDPTRLSQALVNLLGNAIKFTPRGSVSLRAAVLERHEREVLVRFEVQDTGPGIPPEQLGKLFQAFEQADSSTTRHFGGTGLGLAITRHLAQLMGGDAGATSELGVGSTFWITLRLQTAEIPAATRSDELLAGMHVLLVDDLSAARDAMREMLSRLGMRVAVCASGADALALALAAERRGDPFEVAVIDWLMPQMDGVETARRLLAQSADVVPELIIASISLDDNLRQQAGELGVTGFLQKPVSLSSLHDKLREMLAGRAPRDWPAGPDLHAEQALREVHQGAHVLLAEDNAVNQEVATTLLEHAGLVVDVAANGHEAVALARDIDYALILMDMQMPGMDGLEATRVLRADPRTALVPIIAMTANAYVEDRRACEDAGMNDFITKPVDPPVLYDVLARWLKHAPRPAPTPVPQVAEPALLQGIADLDAARGMAFFAHRETNYLRGVRQFVDLYGRDFELLGSTGPMSLEQPHERLRERLHSLGGACVAIGATRLAHEAIRLEMLVLEDATPAQLDDGLQQLADDLARLVRTLTERLSERPTEASPERPA